MERGRWVFAAIGESVPALARAVGLLLAGWLVGWVLARGTTRLLDRLAPGLDSGAIRRTAARLGIERRLAEVSGSVVRWAVLVAFAAAAVETLGLPVLAGWVGQLTVLLPQLLVGVVIVTGGLLVGVVARHGAGTAAAAAGVVRADLVGRMAQAVVVATALVTGLDQIGFDSRFLTTLMAVTVSCTVGGAALAFALGARTEAGNVVAMHYVRQAHRPGEFIEVRDIRGRIRSFTRTAVVVEVGRGLAYVPGSVFSDCITRVPASEE